MPLNRAPSRSALAWRMVLLGSPLVVATVFFFVWRAQVNHFANRAIESYGTVPLFQLINQNGQPFGSAQLNGKIWIADFVFTTCPGPCPMISTRMSELQKPLEKTDVHLVSFTVDPAKDTPKVLRGYAEKLHAEPGRWDGTFSLAPRPRFTIFRRKDSNSRSQMGGRKPERLCIAPE